MRGPTASVAKPHPPIRRCGSVSNSGHPTRAASSKNVAITAKHQHYGVYMRERRRTGKKSGVKLG